MNLSLVIYITSLSMGGVPTTIVRLANSLAERNINVQLITGRDGPLDHLISDRVNFTCLDRTGRSRSRPINHRSTRSSRRSLTTIVFAPDPESLMMALRARRKTSGDWKLLFGVYHPRCFFPPEKQSLHQVIRRAWFRVRMPDQSIVFMNESTRDSLRSQFGRDFLGASIVPPPIDDPGVRKVPCDRDLIVSVGRLTAWKTYNLYMIEVVAALVARGWTRVRWEVYGSGELEQQMRDEIAVRGLGNNIVLCGEVPYTLFKSTVERAMVFVGMGTSLIEAGLMGVPGVVAHDEGAQKTVGTITQLRGFDVGEQSDHQVLIDTTDLIDRIRHMSSVDYERLSRDCRRHSERFLSSQVCDDFVEAALMAPTWTYSLTSDYLVSVCHGIALWWYRMRRKWHSHWRRGVKAVLWRVSKVKGD